MGDISKELNSILNENKDPISTDGKSPAMFILLLIVTVIAVYFAALYFNSKKEIPKNDKKKYERIIKENVSLKEEKKSIEKKLLTIQEEMKKEKIVKSEIVKEEIKPLEKQVISKTIIDKKNFYEVYNSSNSKSIQCYDYKHGSYNPTKVCINSIKSFLKENKNAFRYQIITVIDQKEIALYNKHNKKLQELILNGISTKRISEATWLIKKYLGKSTIVTSNNYYVKSSKKNSGIILKAYF